MADLLINFLGQWLEKWRREGGYKNRIFEIAQNYALEITEDDIKRQKYVDENSMK